ncbi:MAG: ABC transporter ATP-binding protein [Bacteroidales bacterium]|nr:ABC transporter ATP-binding protein [Bacteroidales bacterium]NLO50554.1 ABC transporter ATP-binding protein [Bacteroidales bacterium]
MRSASLHTSDLSIGYKLSHGAVNLLHQHINLQLYPGEVICLLGPNGSGKSTLIRTLAGFQKPLAGKVFFGNDDLSMITPAQLARRVSVVLTGQVEIANTNVFSMVAYGRTPFTGFMGRLQPEDRAIVHQALEQTGIKNLTNRKFDELSDGEKQKVMIAKSLAQQTPLIFLDEPTAFLDFPARVEILKLLRQAARSAGKAILLSTHDLTLAIRFADSIWMMGKEKPIATGTPEDMVLNGEFGNYFDNPQVTFDRFSGTFTFEAEKIGKVAVAGSGLHRIWLEKALERKGYHVVQETKSDCHISISENQHFVVDFINKKWIAEDISEVLDILKNLDLSSKTKD